MKNKIVAAVRNLWSKTPWAKRRLKSQAKALAELVTPTGEEIFGTRLSHSEITRSCPYTYPELWQKIEQKRHELGYTTPHERPLDVSTSISVERDASGKAKRTVVKDLRTGEVKKEIIHNAR